MPVQPEIRIRYGWLLAENASVPMNELWGDGTPILTYDEYVAIADKYKKAWKPYEKRILHAMRDLLGLEFRQEIIDVYIAPWFGAFSDPMVFGVTYSADRFIDVFTHELLHRLLTDNKQSPYDYDHLRAWKKLFGNDVEFNTLLHIPVHAVHKAILLDELKEPKRLEREIDKISKYPDYKAAWDYVDTHDYRKIIEKLRRLYKKEIVS